MKLPKLNVKLLRKIAKHIKEDARRYDQRSWGKNFDGYGTPPLCNTQGCIAGWAVFLSKARNRWNWWKKNYDHIGDEAKRLLGLTEEEFMTLSDVGNQHSRVTGAEGVEEACRKIDDLIADRAAFVEKW